jgi:Putative Ig domain
MAFVVTTTSLPNGKAGVAYSFTLRSSEGTGAVIWALTAGTLPAGLSLTASTGVISGTPSARVQVNATPLTFEATDSNTPTPDTASSSGLTLSIAATVVPVGSAAVNPTASQNFPLLPQCWPLTRIAGDCGSVPAASGSEPFDPHHTKEADIVTNALVQSGNSGVRLS